MSRMGISCFHTTKSTIIGDLIYRGVELNRQLRELGYRVIEVSPHATNTILFGDSIPPKNSSDRIPFMREHLPSRIRRLNSHLRSLNGNTCDALVNAYTAVLHSQGNTDMLGIEEEGLLVIPKLPH